MIWKIVVVSLSIALSVQSIEDAISEQRVVIHHEKRSGLSDVGQKKYAHQEDKSWAHPSYEFSYKVNDPETHDIKGQHEIREGDEVKGNYWLIEPDGKKRTVNYEANDNNGFNAEIDYTASIKTEDAASYIGIDKDNNDEGNENASIESDTAEIIPNNSNDANIDSDIKPVIEENNLNEQNKLDNIEDGAENISNIVSENINESTSHTTVEYEQCCGDNLNNQENNYRNSVKSYRRYRADNIPEKDKREKTRRNHSQIPILSSNNESNKNNRNEHRNEKRMKQENRKIKDNNKRNNNKRQQPRHNKNLNSPENQGKINHDQYAKIENGSTNEEIISTIKTNTNIGSNIKRKTDYTNVANSGDIYEHRIHIRHPKIIS